MVKAKQTQFDEENADLVALDEIVVESNYWTPDNCAQFDEGKMIAQNGMVAYQKESVFDEGKPEERRVTSTYCYVEMNGHIRSAKLSVKSIKEIKSEFKLTHWSKAAGKTLVATFDTFSGNVYIVWKPKTKKDK